DSFIYDGSTHTGGSAVVSGAGTVTGSAVLSYSGDQVNFGTYTVTATYAGDVNHTGSSDTAAISIAKASSTTVATGDSFIYDGSTHTGGSAVVSGAGTVTGSAVLSYSGDQVNFGTYTVTATYAGDVNHTGSSDTAAISIAKASSTTVATGDSFIYDGSTHTGGSAVVSGAGTVTGSAVLSYSGDQVNFGTYTVTATYAGDVNHTGSSDSTTISIAKASSTTTNNGVPSSAVYTGSAQGISGTTVTGAGGLATGATSTVYYDTLGTVATGDDVLLGGAPTNAGSYRVVSTYVGDLNHTGSSDTDYFSIGKATLTGLATTQSALNIAKQGVLVFSLNSVAGMVDGDTLVSLLSSMSFTLKIGVNTYAFAPSVAIDT